MIEIGDKVRHSTMPDWGVGKVMEVEANGKARIFFIHGGAKTIVLKFDNLKKLEGAEAFHPILDSPTFSKRATNSKHVSLPDARLGFLRKFPDGFDDNSYLKEERGYKVAASALIRQSLNEQAFGELLENGDFKEIVTRALKVVNDTNLIFPNEKMALHDGLKKPEDVQLFAERLFNLLYGHGEFRYRFEAFAQCLEMIKANKWTTMTYFPFLASPAEHVFLKPVVTRHAADLIKADLNYKPELNWLTYSSLLDIAQYLKNELIAMDMPPRDMIDVQSFMWAIRPRE